MAPRKPLRSNLGWSTPNTINVYSKNLTTEILGYMDLAGMAFLGLTGRVATSGEQRVLNALLVALVEHGQTPSTISARLTYLGAPEALQGAVAAGLIGLGNVFVETIEGAARLVQDALTGVPDGADLQPIAERVVHDHKARGVAMPGVGHPRHKPADPRAKRLFDVAREESIFGRHSQLMLAVAAEAERQWQRVLPLNVTGAVGSIASDLGLPWQITRGLGVIGRSVGLVVHLLEETKMPIAEEIWHRVDDEVTSAQVALLHIRTGIDPEFDD